MNTTKTMASAITATLLTLTPFTLFAEAPPPDVQVEINGLRLVKPPAGGDDQMRAFNQFPGTAVSLLFTSPKGGLLSIDDQKCTVTSFIDNKGGDLLKAAVKDPFNSKPSFDMFSHVTKDGKHLSTSIRTPGIPTKGAMALKLTGEAVLQMATEKQTKIAKGVTLKKGTRITSGPFPMTITHSGKPEWGESQLSIELQAKQSMDSLAEVRFLTAEGKEITSNLSGTGSTSFGNSVTVTKTYNLKEKVTTADIEFIYWTDLKTVKLPFSKAFGLGM